MSIILDKKEEVIKLELTRHGRKLLGLGRFAPKYYSFYDDSVLYDLSYYNLHNEDVNSSQDRILNESLSISSHHALLDKKDYEIGNSSIISDYAPSWSIKTLNGTIEYIPAQSSYFKKNFNIKKLDCYIEFNSSEVSYDNIKLNSDYVLIDLEELNVEKLTHNFDLELLYYDDLSGGNNYKKLFFIGKKSNVIDDYIYDDDEMPPNYYDIDIDENFVSYFYDILVDEEIDTDYIINAGRGASETISGIINRLNNSSLPSINSLGIDGSIVSVSPNGDIIAVDEMTPQKEYEGSLCRLLCCP